MVTANFAGRLSLLGNFIGAIGQGIQIDGGADLSIVGGVVSIPQIAAHDAIFLNSSCPTSISGTYLSAPTSETETWSCIHLGSSQNVRVNIVGVVFGSGNFGVKVDSGCTAAINVTGCMYLGGIGNSDSGSNSLRQYNDNVGPLGGPNPAGLLTAPTLVNNTTFTNATGFNAYVYINGGTVTEVAVNGSSTGSTQGAFRLAASETIKVSFSGATTWQWWGE